MRPGPWARPMGHGPKATGPRPMGRGPWAPAQSPITDNSGKTFKKRIIYFLKKYNFLMKTKKIAQRHYEPVAPSGASRALICVRKRRKPLIDKTPTLGGGDGDGGDGGGGRTPRQDPAPNPITHRDSVYVTHRNTDSVYVIHRYLCFRHGQCVYLQHINFCMYYI